ncbi:MAG TPA: PQQ-dependent sugar dehydrogenase [Longimicrobiales bacterium]|nr:PQQ-dependent sugar dehydrogenase [Longimicrobiales bacterium]
MTAFRPARLLACAVVLAWTACASDSAPTASAPERPDCAPDNGGLTLPDEFCAVVVAEGLAMPRHLAVTGNGDVYVALNRSRDGGGGLLALRDTTGDGRADVQVPIDDQGGTGVDLHEDWLYFGRNDAVVRYQLRPGTLAPVAGPEVIVAGLRAQGGHAAKPVQVTEAGDLFVNIGSPSNSCQQEDRQPGSPGKDPCEERERNAGIWRFAADRPGQTMDDGERYAAGLRNTVALTHNPLDGELYGAVHGRDQLLQNWGELYSAEQSAELPAEEFVRIGRGDDFGWPYCYYDHRQGRRVLAPEYRGDGSTVGRCSGFEEPLIGFPGHWAPNALVFYDGDQFPPSYRGGAFIAFHGSWNRAPLPQEGYNVVFVPRSGDTFGPEWEVFADGFRGPEGGGDHRPTGLAVGPDGSLYISDDAGGTIWRVMARR